MRTGDIISRAGIVLNDVAGVRWTAHELLLWISDAQQQLVRLVPDAASTTTTIALTIGPKQTVPAQYYQLLKILRNIHQDGSPGRSIRIARRIDLEAVRSNWYAETGVVVQHYIYEPEHDRRVYYVYPAPAETVQVEAVFSRQPQAILEAGSELIVSDRWINPILDWTLYRAFQKNADFGSNTQRAQQYLQAFYHSAGLEYDIRNVVNPNRDTEAGAG